MQQNKNSMNLIKFLQTIELINVDHFSLIFLINIPTFNLSFVTCFVYYIEYIKIQKYLLSYNYKNKYNLHSPKL